MALGWLTARGYRITLALAVLFAAFHGANELRVLAGGPPNFTQRLELTALDVKLAFRGERDADPWRVAVAAIDEEALQQFGPLPWERSRHAEIVDRLTELQAGAIAFDMTFDQPSSTPGQRAVASLVEDFRAAALPEAAAALKRATARMEAELGRLKRSGQGWRVRQVMDEASRKAADVIGRIRRLDRALDDHGGAANPDAAFAEAIRRSGRVVLGVVAYSQREADALGLSEGAGLGAIASSTISRIASDEGDGLTRLLDGAEHFRTGLYHRFFGLQPPTAALAEATPHFGLINAVPDDDGVNRRMPLLSTVRGVGTAIPSLALKAAQVTLQASDIEILGDPEAPSADLLRVGTLTLLPELGATTRLDWLSRFEPDRFPIVSVVDILDGEAPPQLIRGRAVFVAATAVGTYDQRVTPLEPAVPGVYVHATLAQNILEGRQLSRPPFIVLFEMLTLVVLGGIAGLVMARFRLWGQLATAAGLVAAWIAVNQLVFTRGLVVFTVLPVALVFACLLAMSMWSYLVEQRERRQTRRAFAQYLSPGVLDRVLAEPEEYLKLGGRRYDATVLFSDIRGFTTISEALTPEELGRMLNLYMTPMTNIVFAHQGTLDKYIGDAVMAFWGAPVEQDDHALRACRAALEMQREVERLNERFEDEGLPSISIGIGLSTGPMTIGNMGSDDHFAYTALGDRVNLGARLEGQTKEYGVGIMISDVTYRRVKDEMLCRELGALRVKGKLEPVEVYELIGPHDQNADRELFVETFHHGLALFQARRWDLATEQFMKAQALAGPKGDKVSELYIEWSIDYKISPPPHDWDGVRVATHK